MSKPFVYIRRAGGATTIESPQFIMTADDAVCGTIVSECEKLSMLIRDFRRRRSREFVDVSKTSFIHPWIRDLWRRRYESWRWLVRLLRNSIAFGASLGRDRATKFHIFIVFCVQIVAIKTKINSQEEGRKTEDFNVSKGWDSSLHAARFDLCLLAIFLLPRWLFLSLKFQNFLFHLQLYGKTFLGKLFWTLEAPRIFIPIKESFLLLRGT